ncbi:hypothetical protein EG327_007217 [Venturia inaequalis]|uniref:Uncharacterized protein n=1 Tax=Venturia inaequalis TaxID=5025 RepID=A0A8H3YYU6_VENIN|nr:hypothetical protein EG327_007217 [Venturia inaequalis]
MHLSTLFSNLLVAAQLVSLPGFAHGRYLAALIPDNPAHWFTPRQVCRVRTCDARLRCTNGGAAVLTDEEMNGGVGFQFYRTTTGGVAMQVQNTMDVRIHYTITGFNGHFFYPGEIGVGGVTVSFQHSHWDNWHNQDFDIAVTYRFDGKRKRDLLIGQSAQGEAMENGSTDTPDKPHGSSTNVNVHPNPKDQQKGHQGTGVTDKKPKGGPACPGGCRSGEWHYECRPKCT